MFLFDNCGERLDRGEQQGDAVPPVEAHERHVAPRRVQHEVPRHARPRREEVRSTREQAQGCRERQQEAVTREEQEGAARVRGEFLQQRGEARFYNTLSYDGAAGSGRDDGGGAGGGREARRRLYDLRRGDDHLFLFCCCRPCGRKRAEPETLRLHGPERDDVDGLPFACDGTNGDALGGFEDGGLVEANRVFFVIPPRTLPNFPGN